ncbi:MAG TPA: hypothetical protein VI306_13875, partial [Pyrinomonadaceae bacterium]
MSVEFQLLANYAFHQNFLRYHRLYVGGGINFSLTTPSSNFLRYHRLYVGGGINFTLTTPSSKLSQIPPTLCRWWHQL